MGNRAVITFQRHVTAPCIYLHWNGGRESVEAFLEVAKRLNLKGDHRTRMDVLAEVLAKSFFKTKVGETIYREDYGKADADNWDNGVYVINDDWEIIDRLFKRYPDEPDAAKTQQIIDAILGDDFCKSLLKIMEVA